MVFQMIISAMDIDPDLQYALEARNVVKTYGRMPGGVTALNDVSIAVRENEFFTLLGPSGCGKTTLLRMIAGFEEPTAGEISLHGKNIQKLPAHKRRVNTVFQSYALFPHMTIAQNIAYGLENLNWKRSLINQRVTEMLKLVHMEEFSNRTGTQLSGGQRQRVALARALAPSPELLLLDEPLSALDLKLRQAMRDELRELQRQTGITFVFVTHDQEEALDMSDRICVLGNGVIQQIGTPDEIYENPINRFVADFIGDTNFIDVTVTHVDGDQATVRTPMGLEISSTHRSAIAGEKAVLSLRPEKIDLQDQATGILMDGVIVNRNYLGGYTHYTVKVGDAKLRVSKRNSDTNGIVYNLHEKIKLGFQPSSTRVLVE